MAAACLGKLTTTHPSRHLPQFRTVRRLALSALNWLRARNQTIINPDLIRTVQMDPWTHKVDDRLDARKEHTKPFTGLIGIHLDTCLAKLELPTFLGRKCKYNYGLLRIHFHFHSGISFHTVLHDVDPILSFTPRSAAHDLASSPLAPPALPLPAPLAGLSPLAVPVQLCAGLVPMETGHLTHVYVVDVFNGASRDAFSSIS
ncbi:hypothetical protein B0H14DRAFT_3539015 [Mycena olivaceomarginata]|nr:hypothetical protein B0H14DRAFT_3539015 [Mycena olivaceomarginata]